MTIPTATPLYTTAEAAALLKVSPSWLKRAAAARAVPCRRLGRLVRFSGSDLEEIVTKAADRPVTARLRKLA